MTRPDLSGKIRGGRDLQATKADLAELEQRQRGATAAIRHDLRWMKAAGVLVILLQVVIVLLLGVLAVPVLHGFLGNAGGGSGP
ncbi:MAG: hypothetical protein F4Z77_13175 [Dehalococcoidia bacterium]|nr:hypothetical protein [Dehalococcoidia bacterium]MYA53572.1 hypothetical protein [Dehalococcoidia bacterium]